MGAIGAAIWCLIVGGIWLAIRAIRRARAASLAKKSTNTLSSYSIRIPGYKDSGTIEYVGPDCIYVKFDRLYRLPYYSVIGKLAVEDDPTGEKKESLYKLMDDSHMALDEKRIKEDLLAMISQYSIRLPNLSGCGKIVGIQGQTISFHFDKTYSNDISPILAMMEVENDVNGEKKAMLLQLISDYRTVKPAGPERKDYGEMARKLEEITSYKISIPDRDSTGTISEVYARELYFVFQPSINIHRYSIYSIMDKMCVEGDTTGEKKERLLRLIDEYRRPIFLEEV